MPRSIWKGAISFGLVTIPVKVYGAVEEKDLSFRQVHAKDGGRIRQKRVCEKCGEEVEYADVAKGYEAADGRMAILSKEDFENLPLATTKAVEVVQFVDASEIDPIAFDKPYYLEAEATGQKPYVLLRNALKESGKVAVVKVALRSREALAVLRVSGDVMVMQTMLWPDEVRDSSFAAPPEDVSVSKAEIGMATMFIDQMSGEFTPSDYTDTYREALETVVASKLDGVEIPASEEAAAGQTNVVDLVAALRASVEAAKARRAEEQEKTERKKTKAS
ncbi:MAG TPA: Ku protein [Propionibacteriaceae bacterium]|nr:Ku protein [Propionibacteriaceae bacterium]